MNILLAVDGSKYTKKMLAYLVTHETLFGAQRHHFQLFTAVSALPPRAKSAVGSQIAKAHYADEAKAVLEPVEKFLTKHGFAFTADYKVGRAGDLIAEAAEQRECDLVVMGSHGHGALGNLVMGSVATQVLAQCKVPVLLVR